MMWLCLGLAIAAGACAGLLTGALLAVIQESRKIEREREKLWNGKKRN